MEGMLKFFYLVYRLKDLPRTGWVNRQVPNPEVVASHMWGAAIMALLYAHQHNWSPAETLKLVSLVLVHDLAEVITGDLVPVEEPDLQRRAAMEADKLKNERLAITEMAAYLGEDDGPWILALWEEFEDGKTHEAKIARQIDKLECVVQAKVYANAGHATVDPRHFASNSLHAIHEPEFLAMLEAMECL